MNRPYNDEAVRTVRGVEYHAVTAKLGLCKSHSAYCAVYLGEAPGASCHDMRCHHDSRADRTDVIWVKAA